MAAEYAYQFHAGTAPEAVPQPLKQPQRPARPTIVPQPQRPRRSVEERKRDERAANRKIAAIFVVLAFAFALLGVFVNSFVASTNSRHHLESVQKTLKDYSEANVVLNHRVSVLISADNIDKIATERLGLVKIASGNESYVERSEGNQVVLSQSKN